MKFLPHLAAALVTLLFTNSLSAGDSSGSFDRSHSDLNAIVQRYVNGDGMVDYASLKENRADLDQYLETTAAVEKSEFDSWPEHDRIAFLINVYNAETLQLIIDRYPIQSIQKIGLFPWSAFKTKCVELFGKTIDLTAVEQGMLGKKYDEPRVHFGLFCAAMGCPPLRREAFRGVVLDAQLDDQARRFLRQETKNYVSDSGELYLSSIFRTYKSDFTKGGTTVQEYVNLRLREDVLGMKIKYTNYDWDLNDQASAK